MTCLSVLSTSVSKRLTARIQELLNDGLSDSEIVRAIRRETSTTHAWPEMSFGRIKKCITEVMEAEEAKETSETSETSETLETSEPSFETDEEDEEYVPESETETETKTETETESETASESESESESAVKKIHRMTIYFDRDHKGTDLDRLVITPQSDGTFAVEMSYDLTSSTTLVRHANHFQGDANSIDLYVDHILQMVAMDDLPFHSLEFAVPFFPTISLKPSSLGKEDVHKVLMNAIRQFLKDNEA